MLQQSKARPITVGKGTSYCNPTWGAIHWSISGGYHAIESYWLVSIRISYQPYQAHHQSGAIHLQCTLFVQPIILTRCRSHHMGRRSSSSRMGQSAGTGRRSRYQVGRKHRVDKRPCMGRLRWRSCWELSRRMGSWRHELSRWHARLLRHLNTGRRRHQRLDSRRNNAIGATVSLQLNCNSRILPQWPQVWWSVW